MDQPLDSNLVTNKHRVTPDYKNKQNEVFSLLISLVPRLDYFLGWTESTDQIRLFLIDWVQTQDQSDHCAPSAYLVQLPASDKTRVDDDKKKIAEKENKKYI